jgi:transposase, IS5 family
MRRDLGQMSLADGLVNQRAGRNGWLDRIDSIIDWPAVVKVLDGIYASDEGRPSYPLVMYVKLLLLQQWSGRSWRKRVWRKRCSPKSAASSLAKGLIVRKGTLIDATLVAAAVKPLKGNAGEVSERDPEAGWTKKNGKSHFGYKAHIAVDEGSEIIRDAILTADLHDSRPAASLIQGDEKAVYGDKAYASEALRMKLAAAGIDDRVMYKASRNKPLKPWQTCSTRWWPRSAAPSSAGLR